MIAILFLYLHSVASLQLLLWRLCVYIDSILAVTLWQFRKRLIILDTNHPDNPCDWKIVECPINTCTTLRNDDVIVGPFSFFPTQYSNVMSCGLSCCCCRCDARPLSDSRATCCFYYETAVSVINKRLISTYSTHYYCSGNN